MLVEVDDDGSKNGDMNEETKQTNASFALRLESTVSNDE